MQTNTAKRALQAGKTIIGTSLEISLDPEMAPLLRAAGLDFFYLDTEHGPVDYHQIQALCRTGRTFGLVPLVRVTQNEPYLITRALDVGAMGVIVPRVHSPEEARVAIDCIKYPPDGHRGYGMRGIIHDFRPTNPIDEMESSNRETLAVLQIESKEGLCAVEAIAATPHLDALFIGPYDLTISMGIAEDFHHSDFWAAVDRVVAACMANRVAAGMYFSDMDLLKEACRRGVRFVLYSNDVNVLLEGFRRGSAELRVFDNSQGCSVEPAIPQFTSQR